MRFRATIERGHPDHPRFAVLPDDVIDALGLTKTTTVLGTMAGVAINRQAVKPIRGGGWFVDVTGPVCKKAKVDTGDVIEIELEVVGEELPADLAAAIAADAHAQAWWDSASPSKRRQAVNSVERAKTQATREKRIVEHVKLTSDFQRWRTTPT